MQARAFNSVSINAQEGIFTKTSLNVVKLRDEINYYLGLPKKIASFFPQLLDYRQDFTSYTMEYIPYKDLSVLILANQLTFQEGKTVLQKLMSMLDELHHFKPIVHRTSVDIENFYIKKTFERVNDLKSVPDFRALIEADEIIINNKSYQGFEVLKPRFQQALQQFSQRQFHTSAIHGDFSFGNILYCPVTQSIKLIDPRGSFGNAGIYGHSYYDYAKLLHCVHGGYDYIVNNQYQLQEKTLHNFLFKRESSSLLEDLHKVYRIFLQDKGIEIDFLYLIEASLFLSMAVLHYEDGARQKALFLNGLMILNNFFEGQYAHLH